MTMLVIDKTDPNQLRDGFTLLGTPFKGTRFYWLNVPLLILAGIIIGLIIAPAEDVASNIIIGVIYGVIIFVCMSLHTIGHIVSSRMVGAPVTHVQMSATVSTLYYDDTDDLPSRVHIGRSVGGPLFNLVIGLIALLFYSSSPSHYLAFFMFINLLLFVTTILPIPTLDGAVILRELRK